MGQRTATIEVNVRNTVQDATQASEFSWLGNNLPLNPSIEDMNRIVSGGQSIAEAEPTRHEHLFGNHIREAVAIVKDWVKQP